MTTSSASEPAQATAGLSPSASLAFVYKKASPPNLDRYSTATLESPSSTSSDLDASTAIGSGSGTAATTAALTIDQDEVSDREDHDSTRGAIVPPTFPAISTNDDVLLRTLDPSSSSLPSLPLPPPSSSSLTPNEGSIPTILQPPTTQCTESALDPTIPPALHGSRYWINDSSTRDSLESDIRTSSTNEHETLQQLKQLQQEEQQTPTDVNDDDLTASQSIPPPLPHSVDMSMTSPSRQTKSPPPSTSSTMSGNRRRIAESSMILSATGSENGTGFKGTGLKGGTLSPAWSMTSIPRDISATYETDPNDGNTVSTAPPMDERLYGLVDRYGFLVEEGRTPTAEKNGGESSTLSSSRRSVRTSDDMRKHAKAVEKEQERSLKWARMAKRQPGQIEIEYTFPESSKFVSRIYKGVPDCWRAAAWSHLIQKRSKGFEPSIRRMYHEMLEISSPEEEQIDLDIPRTMHGHIMFRTRFGAGQCSLFKVLKAYSNYNHKVGYCQGMASVVAMMLTFFDAEKTFVLLAQLFERYHINDLVVPGFPALFEAFYIQEELTKIYAPKVFQALETMGIATPSYASRWYITLYSAGVVPHRTLLRIWDIFLLEGFDWLYFMALALLQYHESSLIQNNFERTMEMLNAKMDIQDDERLLRIAHDLLKKARRTNIVARLKRSYASSQKQA